MLRFDPHQVPFSGEGAYLSISMAASWTPVPRRLHVRFVHGAAFKLELFDIELFDSATAAKTGSEPLAYTAEADVGECRFSTPAGVARFAYGEDGSLRFRVDGGVRLRLTLSLPGYNDYLMAHPDGCLVNSSNCSWLFALRPLRGELVIEPKWNGLSSSPGAFVELRPRDGVAEMELAPFGTAWPDRTEADRFTFDQLAHRSRGLRPFHRANADVGDRARIAAPTGRLWALVVPGAA